jgi:hypothetical protein
MTAANGMQHTSVPNARTTLTVRPALGLFKA